MQFTKENAYALAEELIEAGNLRNSELAIWDLLTEIEARDMFAKPHTGRPKTLDRV